MAIGEFGGAPAVPGDSSALLSAAPMYWFYEMSHAALNQARAWADATRLFFKNPINPLSFTTLGKSVAAACELFERSTRRYGRPEWRIDSTLVGGERVQPRLIRDAHAGLDAVRLARTTSTPDAVALRALGLTPRQADVLALLVQGHTSRQIAATLVLSPRTVEKHIDGLYARLGVRNRSQAVAAAMRRPPA